MLKSFLITLVALLVVLPAWTMAGSAHDPVEQADQSECEEQGGKWEVPEEAAPGGCNLPTLDAGRVCNDSSECQSACIAEGSMLPGVQTTGFCYGWSLLQADCVNPISSGITQGSTCDD